MDIILSSWRTVNQSKNRSFFEVYNTSKYGNTTYGSWKNYYLEEETGEPCPNIFRHKGCNEPAEDGCHVYNSVRFVKAKLFIVPLYKACNYIDGSFSLKPNTVLADLEDKKNTKDK